MTASTGRAHGSRVLIVVENLPVPFDRRVWQEATTLAAAGYRVSIICPTGKGYESRHEVIDGIAVYRHPLPLEARGKLAYPLEYGAALFWQLVLSCRVFASRGFDVIHACNPPDLVFLYAAPFKLLFGTKFLFDQHDLCPELYEANFGRRDALYRVLRWVEALTYRLADVVIATNLSYRRIAIERGKVAAERVHVVRSGPSLARLRILPPDDALKRGRRYLVGYVGVIGAHEGIPYLLQAIRHIVVERGRQDVQFGLVGGGPALAEMQRMAEGLGIADYITFTGRVADDELLAMLNTSDVCVNPDEYNEMNDKSTMNKIMEYMALGKPIVQFDLTEGRFSAQDASLYAARNDAVDLAEKILLLLDDPARREAMGRFGRERVLAQFTWEHEVPKLLAAYEALNLGRARRTG
jgi:glycosyltransferase involved in cell wall biosynthesis